MNLTSRAMHSSSSTHVVKELNFIFSHIQIFLFTNLVQRFSCRIEFQTMFELVWFIVSHNHD